MAASVRSEIIKRPAPVQPTAQSNSYSNLMMERMILEAYFTASTNALSVSSDGQQQPSTPLFGFGASSSTLISSGQPVIGAPANNSVLAGVPGKKSILALFLTTTAGKKISVFVAFGRGAEESNASALVALSDVFTAGVVKWRLLSGWSFQQRLEPCK
ncbi:MAG TPA: hypothetical protein VM822_27985 [Pseudolabrys sp.]|jgi:hypothetical protein|nr:hypothetical protein [Pseudolabrys sp.]